MEAFVALNISVQAFYFATYHQANSTKREWIIQFKYHDRNQIETEICKESSLNLKKNAIISVPIYASFAEMWVENAYETHENEYYTVPVDFIIYIIGCLLHSPIMGYLQFYLVEHTGK